jgi:hypothetical protein
VVLVAADDEVDAVPVEEGCPLLPDAEIGSVELVG